MSHLVSKADLAEYWRRRLLKILGSARYIALRDLARMTGSSHGTTQLRLKHAWFEQPGHGNYALSAAGRKAFEAGIHKVALPPRQSKARTSRQTEAWTAERRESFSGECRVRFAERPVSDVYLPTEEEIRAACQAIQATWTPAEEELRRGGCPGRLILG